MAATPEKKVKDKVVKILKEYEAYYFYPVTGGFGASGVPDIIACYNGKFVGIEVKADLKKRGPTALQMKNLAHISKCGGVALIVDKDNTESVRAVLETLK